MDLEIPNSQYRTKNVIVPKFEEVPMKFKTTGLIVMIALPAVPKGGYPRTSCPLLIRLLTDIFIFFCTGKLITSYVSFLQ